jgi:hypothetical protein
MKNVARNGMVEDGLARDGDPRLGHGQTQPWVNPDPRLGLSSPVIRSRRWFRQRLELGYLVF